MGIVKAQTRGNFTVKIGDMNYGTTIPMGGHPESIQDNVLLGFMNAIDNVSEGLVTTATKTVYVNTNQIPPNTRGKKPRTFKFQVFQGNTAVGQEAANQIVTIRIPEFNGGDTEEQVFITYCLDFLRVYNADDEVQHLQTY